MTTLREAYDLIDRFLRNNLYDDDYAEYSEALELLSSEPPQRKPLTDEHNPQYQVIERQGRWQLVYDKQHHQFRIQKLRHDICLYPGIELIQAQKRFCEHVENDNE